MLELLIQVFIVLILIAFNGLLSMSELAVVSSRAIRLQQRAEGGDEGAQTALDLASEPTRFLSTVQIGITLIGILAGTFGGASIAGRLDTVFVDAGLSESISGTLSLVVVVAVITYLSLVFGEIVPKRIAMHNPERIAAIVARPMRLLSQVSAPFVGVLTVSTSAVLRLIGLGGQSRSGITEEEIRLMIGMSAESGSVEEAEAELLDRVFHFGDRRVHEVMTPRTEVVWVPSGSLIRDFFPIYAANPHSRFPVFEDTPDNVIGILGIKEVLRRLALKTVDEEDSIRDLLMSAMFTPETKLIGELFREMQEQGMQMAIAVDEFGGTAGIVTLEQLIEEMVGRMHDELRPDEVEILEIDERTAEVDGGLSVEEARDELELDIPEGPYDTIAGYLLAQLGRIPKEGESLVMPEFQLTVLEMKGPKIERLRVLHK
ncbi:MAG: hemolysin family protein [Dehalococcoidia bacterium]